MNSGTQRPLNLEQRLVLQLRDTEYRRAFVEGHATDTIAFQLRAMRKKEGLEQREVAERLGNCKLQPMISRYENPDYGKYSISTLLDLAAAFDVALAVRFVPFSELVEWDLSTDVAKECPSSYANDKGLQQIAEGESRGPGMFFSKTNQALGLGQLVPDHPAPLTGKEFTQSVDVLSQFNQIARIGAAA